MKRFLSLFGAVALAAALTLTASAQTSPGPILVTDAQSASLYPSWGTNILSYAEYYCINNFSSNFVAPNGVTFVANKPRVGGSGTWGSPPALANDTYGFGTMMAGDQWAGTMTFNYPAAMGDSYLLELLFYDNFYNTAGSRVFDVNVVVNGVTTTIVSGMDLAALGAGKGDNAIIVLPIEFDNIGDTNIEVQLSASVNNAMISGALLYGLQHVQPAQTLVTGPYDPNLSITNSYNNFTATNFIYAEYYGNNLTNPMTIDGLTFVLNNARLPGSNPYGPANTPNFGATSDAANLALISANDDWLPSGTDDSLQLPTQAGRNYILQLLFHDNAYATAFKRQFNVLSGTAGSPLTNWVSNLDLAYAGAYLTQPADVVLTVTVPGDGNNFVVELQHGPVDNPLLCAVTWQDISPGVGAPLMISSPVGTNVFQGRTVILSAVAVDAGALMTYQWYSGPHGNEPSTFTPVTGANVLGATNTTLTITNITLGQSYDYALVASNSGGSATSSVAYVDVLVNTVVSPGTDYAPLVLYTNNAADYWRLNEPSGSLMVYDCGPGAKDGVTGADVILGDPGPQPPAFPRFEANNSCMETYAGNPDDYVTTPPLNLNTNTVTLTAWIMPNANQPQGAGILLSRQGGGSGAADYGLTYGITLQPNGDYSLRYFWNGASADSGLQVVQNQWSLVALVVTPTNATIYVGNGVSNSLASVSMASTNAVVAFSNPFIIGNDTSVSASARSFNGFIDEVSVFAKALTSTQILGLLTNATAVASVAPAVGTPPAYTIVNPGVPVSLSAGNPGGTPPPSLQWKMRALGSGTYVNVLNATNATLTISSASPANNGDYVLFASNNVGTATSASGRLLVAQANPPALIGRWLTGTNQNLQEVAGYYPAGLHDGYFEGDTGTWNVGDVPPGFDSSLSSLALDGAGAVAITNTSDNSASVSGVFNDTDYRIDFDNNVTNRFSVALWAKGFPSTAWSPFIGKNCESSHGWAMRHNASGAGVPTFSASSLPDSDVGNGSSARDEDSNWHHWCGTYDSSTGFRHLYMDGVDVLDCPGGFGGIGPANGYHMVFGAEENPTLTRYFAGSLFDVRFYNYAVTPAEVQAMIAPGSTGAVGLYFNSANALPVRRPQAFTVLIPMGADATGPVTVWVTNNAPTVASVRGVTLDANNAFAVTFAQGAPNTQSFVLDTLGTGAISFSLGNNAGLTSTAVTAVSVIEPQIVGQWFTGAQSPADNINYDGPDAHDGAGSAVGTTIGAATVLYTNSVPPGFPAGSSLFLNGTYAVTINGTSTKGSGYYPTFDANLAGGFSVSYWALGTVNGSWGPWLSKGARTGTQGNLPGWSVREYNNLNIPTFTINETDDNAYPDYEGSPTTVNGTFATTWHHFVATWDSWSGMRKLYVDGNLSDWLGNDYGPLPAPTYDYLAIGGEDSCGGTPNNGVTVPTIDNNCFKGAMYDVRVYNYALSASEVQNVMNPNVTTTLKAAADTPVIDQGYTGTVSLSLPPGANVSAPVTVWVTNGNPSVVSIAGESTSVFSLMFPAGAYPSEQLSLTGLSEGQATISVGGSSGSGFTPASATNQVYAPDHLTGRWLVGATNLTEYSGFQPAGTHDGTLVGTVPATIWTNDVPAGFPGRSILFNAAYGVKVNNSAATDAGYQSSFDDVMAHKFTVTFWTKTGNSGSWTPWMTKRGDDGIGFQIRKYSTGAGIEDFALRQTQSHSYTQSGSGAVEDLRTTSSKLFDNKWHLVAAIWDGYNGIRQFLVDGQLDPGMYLTGDYATYALARNHHLTIGTEENTTVGGAWGNQNSYLSGMMYDVRIYNYPLTALQVSALMTPPTGPRLTAQLVGSQVLLSWSSAYPGYVVQTAPAVKTSGTAWSTPGLTVTLQNGQYTATDSAPGASPKFYRLVIQE
jgi:hypothetical protein